MGKNPYKQRKLPVGQLEYSISQEIPHKVLRRGSIMLEFGEMELIFDIPRLVGGGKLLNLGDACGGSAILLALGLQANNLEGHIHTVDCYLPSSARRAWRNYKAAGVESLITQYRGTTDEMVERLKEHKFRFIFIDADHRYDSVKKDWLNYSEMLEDGDSLIALHDTNWEGTDKVIQEEIDPSQWEMVYWINRIKAFKRK